MYKTGNHGNPGLFLFRTWLYDMDELRRFDSRAEKLKKEFRSRK
jgi:hypothetical protein